MFDKFIPPVVLEAKNLPHCAEVTLLQSSTSNTLICGLVNYQEELPNISALDLCLKLRLPESFRASAMLRVSNGVKHEFTVENSVISFTLDRLDYIELFELKGE